MEPTFYDIHTFEPLPPSGIVAQPLRPVQGRTTPPAEAATTKPAQTLLRLATAKPLEPAGVYDRLVVTRDRIVALGREELLVLGHDLARVNDLPAPIGTRVDAPRDLIYMADVFGSVVGRRTSDLSIALRLIPTFPSGYERHVLYVDASTLLLASVELQQLTTAFSHSPDITMFEWWRLGDLANVDPSNAVPTGAEVTAETYTRIRPLLFAASSATGDPLVLAQPGHLLWLDHTLKLTADVVIPKDIIPRVLAVDAQGRALLVVPTANADRFWMVDRTGQRLCDIALSEHPVGATSLAVHSAPGDTVYVIASDTVISIDKLGGERWRTRLPAAPINATVLEKDGGLLTTSGNTLLRVGADGSVSAVYEAKEMLVSAPTPRDGEILVTTADKVLVLSPVK